MTLLKNKWRKALMNVFSFIFHSARLLAKYLKFVKRYGARRFAIISFFSPSLRSYIEVIAVGDWIFSLTPTIQKCEMEN